MDKLTGIKIKLRPIEVSDLAFLYDIENDTSLWEYSGTQVPFSKQVLLAYLKNAHLSIYETNQLRLIIETNDSKTPVGMIDLFDFDPQHLRAGIGIIISQEHQQKEYAGEALKIMCDYAFDTFKLQQIYADITTSNTRSIKLFNKLGFVCSGVKKNWHYFNHQYHDVGFYQKIKK